MHGLEFLSGRFVGNSPCYGEGPVIDDSSGVFVGEIGIGCFVIILDQSYHRLVAVDEFGIVMVYFLADFFPCVLYLEVVRLMGMT